MFKLTTLGLVLAVGVMSDKLNSIGNVNKMSVIAMSLISLPIISLSIDLKVLEYSLQIKAISNHLIEKFKEIPEIHTWESKLWSFN